MYHSEFNMGSGDSRLPVLYHFGTLDGRSLRPLLHASRASGATETHAPHQHLLLALQERFTLGVTAILTLAVLSVVITEKVPHSSEEVPLLCKQDS